MLIITSQIIVSTIVVLLYLYFFWRKLREDYESKVIFSTAFLILLGVCLGVVLSFSFNIYYWYWLIFTIALSTLVVSAILFKIKIFEALDGLVLALLPLQVAMFFVDFIEGMTIYGLVPLVFAFLLLPLYFVTSRYYKRILWYRSGKVGFTGLAVLGVNFSLRSVAYFLGGVLSLTDINDLYLSLAVALLGFAGIIYLAKSN